MERLKLMINILGVVIIPLCLTYLGYLYSGDLQEKELRAKYVGIAANILASPPSKDNLGLREWAATTLDSFAEIKLPLKSKKALVEKSVLYGSSIIGSPVSIHFRQVKISDLFPGNEIGVRVFILSGSTLDKHLIFDQIVNVKIDSNAINLKESVGFKEEFYATRLSKSSNIHLFEEIYDPTTNIIISSKQSLLSGAYLPSKNICSNLSGKYQALLIWDIEEVKE